MERDHGRSRSVEKAWAGEENVPVHDSLVEDLFPASGAKTRISRLEQRCAVVSVNGQRKSAERERLAKKRAQKRRRRKKAFASHVASCVDLDAGPIDSEKLDSMWNRYHDANKQYCPHGRPGWRMCPWCNGTNEAFARGM